MNALTIILIAAGGACGALLRVGASALLKPMSEAKAFPLGTLAVNLLGCLAIGLVFGMLQRVANVESSEKLNAFLIAGLLGALTTFSTFALDILKLQDFKGMAMASLYLAISVVLGVGLCALGLRLSGASLGA